jgi:NhaA family Na+:H+ antiporter
MSSETDRTRSGPFSRRPLERFIQLEASEGIILLLATAFALAWANSPWSSSYESLWQTPISLGLGPWTTDRQLHFFINEGLMVIFFFVVGLEIRRELSTGELADPRRAALPVAAALGGMIAPALIYLAMNHGHTRRGWGIPMATDIAFAVGVLTLLGKRVPSALRVFLLALAIIDDIGAIVVIAIFYSGSVVAAGFVVAAAGVLGTVMFRRWGVATAVAYVAPGAIVWLGLLWAGVHPTIAGVILGLLTPVHGGTESPAGQLESRLHPWVAYAIMPLFALANAGVSLHEGLPRGETMLALLGIVMGLVVGKPLGIVTASLMAVRLGLCTLPKEVGFRGLLLVGTVAGIGFTMAIFIAGLAFQDPSQLAAAKMGVLGASVVAGICAVALGKRVLRRRPPVGPPALRDAESAGSA